MANHQKERADAWDEFHRLNQEQRFHLHPIFRLTGIAVVSGLYGFTNGGSSAFKSAGLRFLAENSHRLPKNKSGWYFYHKRKNFVCLKEAVSKGLKSGVKYSWIGTSYFGLEAFFDYARGKIDFLNTVAATVVAGGAYAKYQNLSRLSTMKMVKNGALIGLVNGLLQDVLFYWRNGELWYINSAKLFA